MVIEISGRKKLLPQVRLDDLIGLEPIKKELRKIEAILWLNQHRRSDELGELRLQSFHFCFRGNPGTGKTTVARLIGDIFRRYGILRVGDVVEVDRARLLGSTPGETEIKTSRAIRSALDGVLFVDEAFTLLGSGESSDPGMRALEVIIKSMEDYRDVLIVIFAGYPSEMDALFEAAPGLRSRVPFHLDFPDYSPAELLDIMLFMAASEELELSDEAAGKFLRVMGERVGQPDFSNAREVRNLLDQAKGELSRRLQTRRKVSRWDMKVITALDLGRGDPDLLSSLEAARKEMFRAPLDPGSRSAFASLCAAAGMWSDVVSALEAVEKGLTPENKALLGRGLYILGDRERSWEVFSAMDDPPAGSFYRGLSALWAGDLPMASAMLELASSTEPGSPDVLLALAAAKFFAGTFREAADSFLAGISSTGGRLPPVALRDLPWKKLSWPVSARPLRDALFFAYGHPDRSKLLFTEALIATGTKEALDPAGEIVMSSIDRIPDEPLAHRLMSVIHEASGRTMEAVASLDVALELEPRNTGDWRRLALLLEQVGEKERAEGIFRDILEEDPTGEAGIRLAIAADDKGDQKEAETLYRKAWEAGLRGEERSLCARRLGSLSAASGRFDEALGFFAESGGPAGDPRAAFWHARSLIEDERWQEAENLLVTPYDDPNLESPRVFWLGRLFLARKDLFSARNIKWEDLSNPFMRLVKGVVEAFSGDGRAAEILSDLPVKGMGGDAKAMLCSARVAMKDWEGAKRFGRMALEGGKGPCLWERQTRRPLEEAGYMTAIAEAHLGDWTAAKDGFRRSASSLRHPGPVFSLGVSLVALGKIDEARVILTQLKPASAVLAAKLEELIAQNVGIRKMLADPVDPVLLDLYASL
ncbi:MAG: AAA family ATPase [Thermovirgaceae bacterium]|nr:AAA family ATPase [Synergistales bacterium]HRS48597.1 AAA family ATPase [Thermovirgaceae bacterium]HRU90814.1 AAA family ATPase [Thermovirgaceae bacterium]